jgi:hypothetical protein
MVIQTPRQTCQSPMVMLGISHFSCIKERKRYSSEVLPLDHVHGMHWYSQFRCYMYSISMFLVNQILLIAKLTSGWSRAGANRDWREWSWHISGDLTKETFWMKYASRKHLNGEVWWHAGHMWFTCEVYLVDASYIPQQQIQRAPLPLLYTNVILQYHLTKPSQCRKQTQWSIRETKFT